MKTYRKCPQCEAGQGFKRLWLWGPVWARWRCQTCGGELGFSIKRRIVVGLIGAPFSAMVIFSLLERRWLFAVLAFVVWAIVWRFDTIRLVERGGAEEAHGKV